MKSLILIITIGLISSLTYSAPLVHLPDSLVQGKIYTIITDDMYEMTGILIYQDSDFVILRSKNKVYRMGRSSIQQIISENGNSTDFLPDTTYVKKTENKIESKIAFDPDAVYNIYLTNQILKEVTIKKINQDTIVFRKESGLEKSVLVQDISRIKLIRPSYVAQSIIGGALSGAMLGAIIGNANEPEVKPGDWFGGMFYGLSTFIGGVTGFLAGSVAGTIFGIVISQDEDYDLSMMNKSQKISEIKKIVF